MTSGHAARRCAWVAVAAFACTACGAPRVDGVHHLTAPYNYSFYETYEGAARSFYAAHVAHFGAYELLMTPDASTASDMVDFERTVRRLVADPPKFEPPAGVVAPEWTRMSYGTAQSMDWTHMLHEQLYDILTDDAVDDRQAAGERAIAYYLSEADAAFSTRGYGHRWMEGGGEWAGTFRDAFPAVNGILWAYHWHHAAVYEALMTEDPATRTAQLDRVITVFEDSVLVDLPTEMPLTAEVAPRFSRAFPAAAHIFDNLHMMHDVVNDIMAYPDYDLTAKRTEIDRLQRLMVFAGQDEVVAPGMPMGDGHMMSMSAMRVPTEVTPGVWLPQGHPDARMAPMPELMMPLPAPGGVR